MSPPWRRAGTYPEGGLCVDMLYCFVRTGSKLNERAGLEPAPSKEMILSEIKAWPFNVLISKCEEQTVRRYEGKHNASNETYIFVV